MVSAAHRKDWKAVVWNANSVLLLSVRSESCWRTLRPQFPQKRIISGQRSSNNSPLLNSTRTTLGWGALCPGKGGGSVAMECQMLCWMCLLKVQVLVQLLGRVHSFSVSHTQQQPFLEAWKLGLLFYLKALPFKMVVPWVRVVNFAKPKLCAYNSSQLYILQSCGFFVCLSVERADITSFWDLSIHLSIQMINMVCLSVALGLLPLPTPLPLSNNTANARQDTGNVREGRDFRWQKHLCFMEVWDYSVRWQGKECVLSGTPESQSNLNFKTIRDALTAP